jgi:hypothetical protein
MRSNRGTFSILAELFAVAAGCLFAVVSVDALAAAPENPRRGVFFYPANARTRFFHARHLAASVPIVLPR